MKSKISAAVFGVVGLLFCSGFVIADEGDLLAFDRAYKNPQKALKDHGDKLELPVISKATSDEDTSMPRIVVMKDLLKDLSANDRADFLTSLVLKNGRIVSANLGPLRKNIPEESVVKIVKIIFNRPVGKGIKGNNAPARFAEISKLFKDVPADVRNEFLDSMTFKDGAFVSAYIGGLRRSVELERMDEIVKTVSTTGGAIRQFDSRALCGNGECYDAYCYKPDGGSWNCRDHNNSVCDTSCHDY